METISSPTASQAVGANVAAELARHRVSRATAATELQMSTTSLGHRLAGRVSFRVDELDALALLMGIPVRRFIDDVRQDVPA